MSQKPTRQTVSNAVEKPASGMRAWLLGACAILSGCAANPSPPLHDAPLVHLADGSVRGAQDGDAYMFSGIPFAAPPVGEFRWRPPQPPAPWQGVRDVTEFGADCIQPTFGSRDDHPQSEDCLTLNIATPEPRAAKKLPVLVYIHGGAYFVGSSREAFRNGMPDLIAQDVVMVAPNYRLGRLGFFAHPALTAEATDENAGFANYWLMDEIAALEWVHENIDQFGGDPDNVTILGCSAGGSSINALMASPRARGLFHKAVARSGGGLFNATRDLNTAEGQGLAFAQRAGVETTDVYGLAQLRALNTADVLAADIGPPNFGAMIDGTYLPDQISLQFANGAAASVPYVSGSTSNEASVFGLMGFDKETLRTRFDIDVDGLRQVYEEGGPLSDAEMLRQVQTDFIFTSAALGMAALSAGNGNPAWSYYFDHVSPDIRSESPGADHCADMEYLFASGEFDSAENQAMAELLQDQLVTFMRHGTPNGPGLPDWPAAATPPVTPLVYGSETYAAPAFRAAQMVSWHEKWQADTGHAALASGRQPVQ